MNIGHLVHMDPGWVGGRVFVYEALSLYYPPIPPPPLLPRTLCFLFPSLSLPLSTFGMQMNVYAGHTHKHTHTGRCMQTGMSKVACGELRSPPSHSPPT